MTKFVLILHLCMFEGDPKCISEQIIPYQFKDYYSCIRAGYQSAYESFNSLRIKEINENKLAVKIECKELQGV
tara:strand:+ start:278 stop:496 length:219 start_codon:yes stop_codon:yes gene_type:complete